MSATGIKPAAGLPPGRPIAVLRELASKPTSKPGEPWRFRGIAFALRDGGLATFTARESVSRDRRT
ncbi:MAG: hypothetical protein ACYDHH_03740 [Solirubrobacteraceae bacterium]